MYNSFFPVFFFSFSDYDAFNEAAEQFQPYIKFFATFEKSVSGEQNTQTVTVEKLLFLSDLISASSGGQGADSEAE